MNIKNSFYIFCFVLIGLIGCQPQTRVNDYVDTAPTDLPLIKSTTPTPLSLPITETILPSINSQSTPEWNERNLTGKIVYVDRTRNRIVIMDANGENPKEIYYTPGEMYEPFLGSAVKWSHDGRKLAFGCQKLGPLDWEYFPAGRGDDVRLSLCILDLVENMQGQNNNISHGLQVIEMPEQYTPRASDGAYSNARLFTSLAWIMDDEEIVLTPFCIVKLDEARTDCLDWDNLDHLDERKKEILQNAEFITPSPVNQEVWALTMGNQILILDLSTKEVNQIDMEYNNLLLYWSPDGNKIAVVSSGTIGLLDIQTHSYKKLIWQDSTGTKIEPELITAHPGTGSYVLSLYSPRQNIAWSPDSRYLILSAYLVYPFSEAYARIYAGIYYFDLETGELFPAHRNFEELGFPMVFQPEWNIYIVEIVQGLRLFTSPDWYACNDPENICELYK